MAGAWAHVPPCWPLARRGLRCWAASCLLRTRAPQPQPTLAPALQIYLFYRLGSFFQNYRRYVRSFDSTAMHDGSSGAGAAACEPFRYQTADDSPDPSQPYDGRVLPCGQIAYSNFNDSFSLAVSAPGAAPDAAFGIDVSRAGGAAGRGWQHTFWILLVGAGQPIPCWQQGARRAVACVYPGAMQPPAPAERIAPPPSHPLHVAPQSSNIAWESDAKHLYGDVNASNYNTKKFAGLRGGATTDLPLDQSQHWMVRLLGSREGH